MKKFLSKDSKNIFKWILVVFIVWRLGLFLFSFLGAKFISLRPNFLGPSPWANFDGVHYLNIAERGYYQFEQAFFPFYPLLIRRLAFLFSGNYLLAGMLVSHLSFLVALVIFYQLVKLDFKKTIAQTAAVFLLVFPTSFFFGSVYSESLFLALVLGSFYAARKKYWLLAGILGGFASTTRLVGIFLFPALLVEWWEEEKIKKLKIKIKSLIPLFFILLGLGIYAWYLKKTVGDPLYFIHVQPLFGAERTGGRLILLYQVFWRYFKMIMTTKPDPLYFAVWLEFLTAVGFLGLLILGYFQKMRLSYLVFAFLSYLTPTFTGTFSSMPRYALILFPAFILGAVLAEKSKWLRILYPLFAIILLVICVILFTRGYFVA